MRKKKTVLTTKQSSCLYKQNGHFLYKFLLTSRDEGFSIVVALLSFLVILIGAAALASRSTQGFLGIAAQWQNREARDAAESGVIEVVNELNKEPNRMLLVAGNSNKAWTSSMVNDCTKWNSDDTLKSPPEALSPSPRALSFVNKALWQILGSPGTGASKGGGKKQYQLEDVQYLSYSNRAQFPNPSVDILSGQAKSLIRVNVVGIVSDSSGKEISRARVSREFEVVPKCCKRSFGKNQFGNINYGNDKTNCIASIGGGASGIVVGLGGGGINKSTGSTFTIQDLDGKPISQATCWSGVTSGTSTVGYPSVNESCTNNTLGIGSVSLVPEKFNYLNAIPAFPPSPTLQPQHEIVEANAGKGYTYIYIDKISSSAKYCAASGSACISSFKELDGVDTTSGSGSDKTTIPGGGGNPICVFNSSTATAFCRLDQLVASTGSQDIVFDSSNGIINMIFDNNSTNPGFQYVNLGGSGTISHVKCGTSFSPTTANLCTSVPVKSDANFSSYLDSLNLIANGKGELSFRGSNAALAVNIYAPLAKVIWNGGGSAEPNFLGRIWSDTLELKGSISLQVNGTNPVFCGAAASGSCPPEGIDLLDYVARSFTQASGF